MGNLFFHNGVKGLEKPIFPWYISPTPEYADFSATYAFSNQLFIREHVQDKKLRSS